MYKRHDDSVALVSTSPLMYMLTLTVATATVSVYRAMFTLSGDNVQYQLILSTFNEKTKIKKYYHNIFSDMTKHVSISLFILKILKKNLISDVNQGPLLCCKFAKNNNLLSQT